ncbi:prepilin-type N-terminal cleavage/methylation domain-containing protein [Acinetobacter sp. HY1485]|uniref:prepilin-type N-terminal cleavage/methylation domain-containing protein n=1 Tax=Acinetobacter sp. HY1485 TaxID=2970918 RepID=UPI0022B9A9C9|nr:prepilin-type N-terminal cleavage/methylation domain-containing protein [Acinetobacter sp. HY1485]
MTSTQQGFTLVELMISLVLGLIIVAAAMMLFLSGQKSLALQKGSGDIQENANFALNYITKDIRMANLDNSTATMNSNTANSGIVLSKNNITGATSQTPISASTVSNTSNVNIGSDQLVIQYRPTQTQVDEGLFDCEGTQITSTSTIVLQKYFVRRDAAVATNENTDTALALACAAGRSNNLASFEQNSGQIVMKRVDYFHVLLVVENSAGNLRDITIKDYIADTSHPRILGVKLGILARSSQTLGSDATINLAQPFSVLDQSVTLNSTIQSNNNKSLREVILQTVAVRNGLGDR